MTKELKIWQFAAERLERNESATLLVVAESWGSSPGRQGFKMIIAKDEMRGSVGGGAMEVRLVEQARRQISDSKNKDSKLKTNLIEQVHQKNSRNASGMICSGKQTIIFYRLDAANLKVVREIIAALEKNQPKILRITDKEFRVFISKCKLPVSANFLVRRGESENLSDCERELASRLPAPRRCYKRSLDYSQFLVPTDYRFLQPGKTDFIYEENLGFKNKLSIVGGGHCALALSELMSKMDFYIEVFDDRADLNTLDENRFAHKKQVVESYEAIGDFVAANARNHFVVVMTLGYKSDETVIRKLLDKDFKYFGVLGSRAKLKTLFGNLEKEGFEREKLNLIRAPVGIEINSRTPEEIAVSIAAEIIAVKNAGEKKRSV